jgi:transcriptional regulator with AAA-type ATPase domain
MTICMIGADLTGFATQLQGAGMPVQVLEAAEPPAVAIRGAGYIVLRADTPLTDAQCRVLRLAGAERIPVALVFESFTPQAVEIVLKSNTQIHVPLDNASLDHFDISIIQDALEHRRAEPHGVKIGTVRPMPSDPESYEANRGLSLVSPAMRDFILELRSAVHQMKRPSLRLPWDPYNTQPARDPESRAARRAGSLPNLREVIAESDQAWANRYLEEPAGPEANAWKVLPPPLLVLGETGTGKSLVAKLAHDLLWNDATDGPAHPFVSVNSAGLELHNFEYEMHGARSGQWTGITYAVGHLARAAYGTVLLDEIGDMPSDSQAALLAFFNDLTVRPGDARPFFGFLHVIAATNRDLNSRVTLGTFRHDLLARFGARVRLPPLRDRGEHELRAMVDFVAQNPNVNPAGPPNGSRVITHISHEAIEKLVAHRYLDGNFRELEEIVHAGLWTSRRRNSATLEADDIELRPVAYRSDSEERTIRVRQIPERDDLERVTVESADELHRLADLLKTVILQDAAGRSAILDRGTRYEAPRETSPGLDT